jgi:8-oxo-dGTP pyrophosphatase MutT (NUDIX family)
MHPSDKLCRPTIVAIIRKNIDGIPHILMQTRWKPKEDPVYSGTLELPAGHIYSYEDVHETVKREVFEETGLHASIIEPNTRTQNFTPRDDAAFGFKPFCAQQQLKNGLPWIGFTFLCEVEDGEFVAQESETKDQKWIPEDEIKTMIQNTPEKIFTFHLPPLTFYFQEK